MPNLGTRGAGQKIYGRGGDGQQKDGDSLRIGVRINLLQGHNILNGFLHLVRVNAESRLQQLRQEQQNHFQTCQM